MIPIHFEAVFQPNQRKFCVSIKVGTKKRIVERMSIAKFIRLAREESKSLTIKGLKIVFEDDDDGAAERTVRTYFKQVAESYIKAHWGKPEDN